MDKDALMPSGKFIMPVLFVDGHSKMINFTRSLTADPGYPYEPTSDWIWYKPADGETNTAASSFRNQTRTNRPSQASPRR